MPPYTVAALYSFTRLDDIETLQSALLDVCAKNEILGTLLLAREGINGTIAGNRAGIDDVLAFLLRDGRFDGIDVKFSHAARAPFLRMKVRQKKEIVTLGVPGVDPTEDVGTYVSPQDWNDLISADDVVVIDTRNDYEVDIGTFKGAIDPKTESFSDFPAWFEQSGLKATNKRVAMFCTGGIRCEKSTAYLKSLGIEEVYHLKGGILKYLETIPPEDSLWEGECFVFDERVSLGHGLSQGHHELCRGCRRPVSETDRSSPHYVEGISCPQCHHTLSPAKRRRFSERKKQVALAEARHARHLG